MLTLALMAGASLIAAGTNLAATRWELQEATEMMSSAAAKERAAAALREKVPMP
jgi:hypothetical protein